MKSLELPSFVLRILFKLFLIQGILQTKTLHLLYEHLEQTIFQIAWLLNGIALTKTLYYGKFAHIKFGFDLMQSTMWLDIADITTKSISKDINFTNLPLL